MERKEVQEVLNRIAEKLQRARASDETGFAPDAAEILRQRARTLAAEKLAPVEERECVAVIAFRIGRERFAVESRWVKEVFVLPHLVRVPCTPPFVAGIVNLRGAIVSVIDLRAVLGLPHEAGDLERVLLLANGEMEFGILAEEIEGAREFPRENLSPPLVTLPEEVQCYQRGIFPGPVSLLDASLLLASAQMRVDGNSSPP